MKKIWNLMLVALVMLGAAACTETDSSIEANVEKSGFSFYAEIGGDTRATIEKDGDVWKTAWELNDKLYVIAGDASEYMYEFSCTDVETGKFTCTDNTVAQHVGQPVSIRTAGDHYSLEGKSAFYTTVNVNAFGADAKIELPALTSFFRYTYNGEGDVKLALTADAFRNEDGTSAMEVVVAGKSGENFVAFWPGLDGLTATLTFAVNGMTIKEKELTFAAGMVYNLGTMTLPYEASAYSVVGTHNNWTVGKTPMYKVGDYCVAYGVTFGAAENAFKVLGNDKWYGAAGLTLGTWTTVSATDSPDIAIAAGTYDIYFSEADSKVCVVAAGAEVPAMPVFSIGVVGLGGNWDVDKDMTLEGDYYTLKGVAIADTDTFKLRISDAWAENYGIASSDAADYVAINVDAMYTLVQDGKNMQVSAGTYDLYFNYNTKEFYVLTAGTTPDDLSIPQYKVYVHQYNNTWTNVNLYSWDSADAKHTGGWPGTSTSVKETINGYEYLVWTMPRAASGKVINVILNDGSSQTSDFALGTLDKDYYLLLNGTTISVVEDKENPEPEVVEGEPQPSSWALAGDFNSWGDMVMYTTDTTDLFVAKSVAIGAYKEVKIKAVGNWNTSYGGGINYLNANVWTAVSSGGSNFSIVNAGTYDIYFDNANKRIYVMTEGTDVSAATHQSSNGAAPDLSGASWGLCGAHNSWGKPDIKLEWNGTIGLYVAYNATLKGEFKVRANESWGEDYGCGGTITVNSSTGKSMSRGGGNCKVTAGTYDVYWDLSGKKIWVKTPGSAAPTK